MKTGTLTSMTSGLSIMSLSVIIIVSFSIEASATRGCMAYGHSCYGGHGKRSDPDGQKQSLDADPVGVKVENWESSNDIMRRPLSSEEIRQLRIYMECRKRAIELSRRTRTQPNYMPLLIGKWLTSCRHPFNTNSEINDK